MPPAPHDQLAYSAYEHPASVADVVTLVRKAAAAGEQVRVRGALHSDHGSVLADGFSRSGGARVTRQVMLDQLTGVTIDTNGGVPTGRVTAQAGASLGGDPLALGAVNPQRDKALSLFELLHAANLALPITGGISHQTLAGFLSTGSAGGSLLHSFQDAITKLTLVDGTGALRSLQRGDPDFPAALVSLGLLGVIVEVELQCRQGTFDVEGMRSTQAVSDCDFDLFAGPSVANNLVAFLRDKEYSRVMWWPQPGVERVELWEAKQATTPASTPPLPTQANGVLSPTLQLAARVVLAFLVESLMPKAGQGPARMPHGPAQVLQTVLLPARMTWHFFDTLRDMFSRDSDTYIPWSDRWDVVRGIFRSKHVRWMPPSIDTRSKNKPRQPPRNSAHGWEAKILAAVLRLFVPTSPYATTPWTDAEGFARKYAAESFRDPWHHGLAMDNPVHDRLLPVTFTEIWVPMRHAVDAMNALRALFDRDGFAATGTFCIELYAAKKSDAWISAAAGEDVFRVDPFWFDDGDDSARQEFFSQFWDTLQPFDARLHWGKVLSPAGSSTGVLHRHKVLPKLADFIRLRQAYDPMEIFLTEHWKRHLGIP